MNSYEVMRTVVLAHFFASLSCAEQLQNPTMEDSRSLNANPEDSRIESTGQLHGPKDSTLCRCDQHQRIHKPSFRQRNPDWTVLNELSTSKKAITPNTIGKIVNQLSERLVSEIGGEDNLFFSPFSISVTLAMTYLGARGITATEMEKVLGYRRFLGAHVGSVHSIFHDKMRTLENTSEEYKLHVANGFFLQNGFELNKQYTDELKHLYGSDAKSVDFANNSADAVEEINQWSSNKTKGKIPKFLDEMLDPSTKMMMLNAIYFKGFWKYSFSDQSTATDYFYKADGTNKKTLFMLQKRRFSYYSDEKLGYRFLNLPYKGDHLSMLFILPLDTSKFPSINVTSKLLHNVRRNLRREAVVIRIPKFQMSYKRELTTDMKNLGLISLFSSHGANLSGMRAANDLYASMMVHKAIIDVNEQGSEAAAVSGISFGTRSGSSDTHVFTANHPFLFCIMDNRSNTILFMGRVSDP